MPKSLPLNATPATSKEKPFMRPVLARFARTPTPDEGNPAYKTVLTCLAADKAKLNQANPRLSYWSNSTQIKAQDWDAWFTDVKRAQHSDCPDTDPAVFDEAKKRSSRKSCCSITTCAHTSMTSRVPTVPMPRSRISRT